MNNQNLSEAQANLKLALWNAEAESSKNSEFYERLKRLNLPEEIITRLLELLDFTKKVGHKIFAVGKIVVLKILEFIEAHPFLVVGAGIGAVIGAVVAGLITSIPFLGQLLAPVAKVLGLTITTLGAVVGHRLDKQFKGVGKDITEIVKDFFTFFSDVFNTVFGNAATA